MFKSWDMIRSHFEWLVELIIDAYLRPSGHKWKFSGGHHQGSHASAKIYRSYKCARCEQWWSRLGIDDGWADEIIQCDVAKVMGA